MNLFKSFFLSAGLFLAAAWFQFQNLHACSCAYEPIDKKAARSDFIGVGQIVKLEHVGEYRGKVTVRVAKIYKGSAYKAKLEDLVGLTMPSFTAGDAGCAYRFRLGENYLVFGKDLSDITGDKVIDTNLCSQNRSAGEKGYAEDIKWLEANSN